MTAPPTAEEIAGIRRRGAELAGLREEIRHRIVGQDRVVEEVLMALLAEGHCLIIGVPGLAKTLLVSTIAELLGLAFKRIQFTPDLMPNDITGATIIAEGAGGGDAGPRVLTGGERTLQFLRGPIFTNLLLADEINRTPPKTQAALMEAMEERQITAHGRRHRLDRPFFVLATQNPIEQEGTYPLPVSQLDRFVFSVLIDYPSAEEEFQIMELTTSMYHGEVRCLLDKQALIDVIALTRRISVPEPLVDYTTRIVRATRPVARDSLISPLPVAGEESRDFEFVREWVSWGAGPRAVQSVIIGARAHAMLGGRAEVTADDIHRVVAPALRHRIILNYHGQAEGITTDRIVERVLRSMPDGLYRPPEPPARRRRGWSLFSRLLGG